MNTLKLKLDKCRFSLQFFAVAIILSVTSFVLLADVFKKSTSSITILVNAKSSAAIKQQQIVNNLVEIPNLLSFYDRMLAENPDVRDVAQGKSPDKRKAMWNSMLETETVDGDSSMIRISITANKGSDAQQLVQKTTRTLLNLAGMYYDVRDELDLRIIEGPITRTVLPAWYWVILLSVTLGILVTFILQSVLLSMGKVFDKKRVTLPKKEYLSFTRNGNFSKESGIKSLEELYKIEESEKSFFEDAKKAEQRKEDFLKEKGIAKEEHAKRNEEQFFKETYPNFPEAVGNVQQKKAEAPSNLPVAKDAGLPKGIAEGKGSKKDGFVEIGEEKKTNVEREPTDEEIKKRLNQLLRGK
ncbi:MAG TPA: hypothetical protein PK260_00255 [Candidatus Moranbacteria bacterium]|nr:hypothetical protein [Candidatus Moranbacteria bacterium]